MAALTRMQIRWERTTGVAADDQTNTVYAYSDELDADEVALVMIDAWKDFTAGYREHMAPSLFTGKVNMTCWDMADPEPRVPIEVDETTITCTGGTAVLPEEVAMVCSFQAIRVAGQPQARRRGRIYLPTPSNEVVVSSGYVRFDTTFTDLVTELASGVKGALLAESAAWAVFSPTIFAIDGSIAAAHSLVRDGWIDTEPDTQRRRGAKSGLKRTWE